MRRSHVEGKVRHEARQSRRLAFWELEHEPREG